MTRPNNISMAALRRLLALARDLMQAPDLKSTLNLVGPAVHELVAADGAVLLLTLGERQYGAEFDNRGVMTPIHEASALYRCAPKAMDDHTPILLPDVGADPDIWARALPEAGVTSLLAFPFPPSSQPAFLPLSGIGRGPSISWPSKCRSCARSANSRARPLEISTSD